MKISANNQLLLNFKQFFNNFEARRYSKSEKTKQKRIIQALRFD